MASVCVESAPVAFQPLNFPPSLAHITASPTFTSSDLFSPFSAPRATLPTVAQFVRPSYGKSSNTWGTVTATYGGMGPAAERMRETGEGAISRSHRHYGTGCTSYYAPDQPYRVTALNLSQCRPCDQLLPKPLLTAQVVQRKQKEEHPRNGAFTSHVSKFAVFPSAITDAGGKQVLTPRTVNTLHTLHADLYCNTSYKEKFRNYSQWKQRCSHETLPSLSVTTDDPVYTSLENNGNSVQIALAGAKTEMRGRRLNRVSETVGAGNKAHGFDSEFDVVRRDDNVAYPNGTGEREDIERVNAADGHGSGGVNVAFQPGQYSASKAVYRGVASVLEGPTARSIEESHKSEALESIGDAQTDANVDTSDTLMDSTCIEGNEKSSQLEAENQDKPSADHTSQTEAACSCSCSPGEVVVNHLPEMPEHFRRITSKYTRNRSSTWPCCIPHYLFRRPCLLSSSVTAQDLPSDFASTAGNFISREAEERPMSSKFGDVLAEETGDGETAMWTSSPSAKGAMFPAIRGTSGKRSPTLLLGGVVQPGNSTATSTTTAAKRKLPRLEEHVQLTKAVDTGTQQFSSSSSVVVTNQKDYTWKSEALSLGGQLTNAAAKSGQNHSTTAVARRHIRRKEASGIGGHSQLAMMPEEGAQDKLCPIPRSEASDQVPPLSRVLSPSGSRVPHRLGLRFKTEAHARYHSLYPDKVPDLRESHKEGKKYFFYDFHASAFRG